MPYMHSESALVHAQAAPLFAQPGMEDSLRFELRQKLSSTSSAATPTATP